MREREVFYRIFHQEKGCEGLLAHCAHTKVTSSDLNEPNEDGKIMLCARATLYFNSKSKITNVT